MCWRGNVGRESLYCLDLTLYMFDWQHTVFNKLSYWEKDTKGRTEGARWRDRKNKDLTAPQREKCHMWNLVWKGQKYFIAQFYWALALYPDVSWNFYCYINRILWYLQLWKINKGMMNLLMSEFSLSKCSSWGQNLGQNGFAIHLDIAAFISVNNPNKVLWVCVFY